MLSGCFFSLTTCVCIAELRQQSSKRPVPNPQVSTACDPPAQSRGEIETGMNCYPVLDAISTDCIVYHTAVATSSTPVRDATEYNDSGPPGSPTELPDKAICTSNEGMMLSCIINALEV